MKNLLLFTALMASGFAGMAQKTKLTKGERTFAIQFLRETQDILLATVKEVDGELWDYKPTPDSWSVANCFEHLLYAEGQLTAKVMEQMITSGAGDPTNLSSEDGIVIAQVTDRTKKVKTAPPFEPTGRWSGKEEMIDELNRSRAVLTIFLESTKANLRSFKADSPVGRRDAYQHLLIIGAHGLRHTMQMKGVIEQFKATASK